MRSVDEFSTIIFFTFFHLNAEESIKDRARAYDLSLPSGWRLLQISPITNTIRITTGHGRVKRLES